MHDAPDQCSPKRRGISKADDAGDLLQRGIVTHHLDGIDGVVVVTRIRFDELRSAGLRLRISGSFALIATLEDEGPKNA